MKNCPIEAEIPAPRRYNSCVMLSGVKLKIRYGADAKHENIEKKKTIKGPGTLWRLAILTLVYANPAHAPPIIPIRAGMVDILSKPGLRINKAPIKAVIIQINW